MTLLFEAPVGVPLMQSD